MVHTALVASRNSIYACIRMLKILFATGIEHVGMACIGEIRKEIGLTVNHARAKGVTKISTSRLFVFVKGHGGGVKGVEHEVVKIGEKAMDTDWTDAPPRPGLTCLRLRKRLLLSL